MAPIAGLLDVISGGFRNRVNGIGGAGALGFGDSIWNIPQDWSLLGQFTKAMVTAGYPCNGGVGVPYNNIGAGWPVRPTQINVGAAGTRTTIRPGEPVPADSTSKNNLGRVDVVQFTGDYTIFGTPITYLVSNSVGTAWESGKTLVGAAVGFSSTSPRGPASWRLQTFNRAGTQVNADNPINLNQAAQLRTFPCAAWAAGSGGADNTAKIGLAAWNENETGWQLQVLSVSIRVQNPSSGIYWGYAGYGSWTSKNHASSSGQSITADPPTYTGAWSDAALTADILAHRWDTFLWRCGANASEDGIGAYPTEVAAWRTRVAACSAAARAIDPTIAAARFVLVSPYATTSTESYWDAIRTANRDLALANRSDTEHVDECGYVYANYGSYATYSGTLLRDGIHPKGTADGSTVLRDALGTMYATRLMGANVGIPTGGSAARASRATRNFARELR